MIARGGSPLGRRASQLAPPRPVTMRTARAPLRGPVAVGLDVWPPGLPARAAITHAHYSSGAMGTSRPTAIRHAKCTPPLHPQNTPLARPLAPSHSPHAKKGGHPLGCPPWSLIGNHARSITNGECRLLCTMPHDTPRRPQAVCAQHHPSSPQAPQPWQPSAEACRQRASE